KAKNWKRLSVESRRRLVEIELENARQAVLLDPNNTYYILCLAKSCARLGNQNNDQTELNRAYAVADQVLEVEGLANYDIAEAHHTKAEVLRYQKRYREAI